MAELRLPEPSEKQKQFLRDEHRYIGYGGARGGGKSWAVRVKAVLLCLRYAGIKVMIVRRTYPELRENHILPLCRMLGCYGPEEERIAVYHEGQKTIAFPNGSRILFRYLENESDALRFQGSEVDVLFVDEATQQSEEKMESLRACVRGVNDFPKRMYFTCNPGGEGHGWVKRLFIDRRFREGEDPGEHSFIQALVTDNHALMEADPDYVRRLEALPPRLRQASIWPLSIACGSANRSVTTRCPPTAGSSPSRAFPSVLWPRCCRMEATVGWVLCLALRGVIHIRMSRPCLCGGCGKSSALRSRR